MWLCSGLEIGTGRQCEGRIVLLEIARRDPRGQVRPVLFVAKWR